MTTTKADAPSTAARTEQVNALTKDGAVSVDGDKHGRYTRDAIAEWMELT